MKKLLLLLCLIPNLAFAQSYGTGQRISVNLNGNIVGTLPVANGGNACSGLRTISSGASDAITGTECGTAWNSATAAVKIQTIPSCSVSVASKTMFVVDEYGSSSSYPIVVSPSSGTINKTVSVVLDQAFSSVSFICDGANTNWLVLQ